jgi:hypothetical protein
MSALASLLDEEKRFSEAEKLDRQVLEAQLWARNMPAPAHNG